MKIRVKSQGFYDDEIGKRDQVTDALIYTGYPNDSSSLRKQLGFCG